jgi:thiamine pyrophosphokinase
VGCSGVIVIGGAAPHPAALEHLPAERFVVAADSGLDHARTLGLHVDLVVGDLDSVSAGALAEARQAGIPVTTYPVEKDAIDTELAIAAALDHGCEHITLLTGGGDRLDHLLAGLLLLAHPRLAATATDAYVGTAHVGVVHGPGTLTFTCIPGELVSLLPVGGPAEGITTSGLRYPLAGEPLATATTRGVSNEALDTGASVRLDRGSLLVVRPYALGGAP